MLRKGKPQRSSPGKPEWLHLAEALHRAKMCRPPGHPVAHELGDYMRSERLPTKASGTDRYGNEFTKEPVEPQILKNLWLQESRDNPTGIEVWWVDPQDQGSREQLEYGFFVERRLFEKLYSATAARSERTETASSNEPRRKPGKKTTKDWDIRLAAWIGQISVSEPHRLGNVAQMARDAEVFLQNKIGWAPGDAGLKSKINDIRRMLGF